MVVGFDSVMLIAMVGPTAKLVPMMCWQMSFFSVYENCIKNCIKSLRQHILMQI